MNPRHVFQDDIPLPSSELRVRHTCVYVDGDQLLVFYSRRGKFQERIQLSTMDLNGDWLDYDPTYPPKEILAPNPGWEGGQKPMANSLKGKGVDMNQLRDPSVFQDDSDDKLYLLYSGNGEGDGYPSQVRFLDHSVCPCTKTTKNHRHHGPYLLVNLTLLLLLRYYSTAARV